MPLLQQGLELRPRKNGARFHRLLIRPALLEATQPDVFSIDLRAIIGEVGIFVLIPLVKIAQNAREKTAYSILRTQAEGNGFLHTVVLCLVFTARESNNADMFSEDLCRVNNLTAA